MKVKASINFPIPSFYSRSRSLRVLMYHNVSNEEGRRDALTVSSRQLEEQFRYLLAKGYTPVLLSEIVDYLDDRVTLPHNPILITFDDGYLSNARIVYPLAQKYGIKVNFFVVPSFLIKGTYLGESCMQAEDLKKMDGSLVEFGLHSFAHDNYAELEPLVISQDIENCILHFQEWGIRYQPCLAYPYGAFPKRKGFARNKLFEILEQEGIRLAFRIGNRINRLPINHRFLLQRLDIRGSEPFGSFKLSLAWGRKYNVLMGLYRWGHRITKPKQARVVSPRPDHQVLRQPQHGL